MTSPRRQPAGQPTPADTLAQLAELDGVAEAVRRVREAVVAVHRHPSNRRGWAATAAEASLRAARASAGLAGGALELPAEGGAIDDPVLAGAVRVADALGGLLSTWQRAPLQALARMHVLAAADLLDSADLGRPRTGRNSARRLDLLAELLTGATAVAGPVLAAVVHGELLAVAPFGAADGVVARAAARLTTISTGLDTKGLIVPEVFWLRRATTYRERAEGFASGTAEGVGAWLRFCCEAMQAGAAEARGIADAAVR
ncbi:MAG: oxidoreductase [Sciscionella sp.]